MCGANECRPIFACFTIWTTRRPGIVRKWLESAAVTSQEAERGGNMLATPSHRHTSSLAPHILLQRILITQAPDTGRALETKDNKDLLKLNKYDLEKQTINILTKYNAKKSAKHIFPQADIFNFKQIIVCFSSNSFKIFFQIV